MASAAELACFMYHDVTDDPAASGFQRIGALPYKHTRRAFSAHLDALASAPHAPTSVLDIDAERAGRHVLLTFDDGGKSALDASAELSRRGWRGHFFIVTSLIGCRTFLNADDIRSLRSAGHVIGSHSHTHPVIFRELPFARMVAEWQDSSARLADILGEPCVTASVPGGDISRLVLQSAAVAGIRFLFTSEPYLAPRRVGDCWVIGRFITKTTTTPALIGELARFRGWRRALFTRRLKVLARRMLPGAYRRYLQRGFRELRPAD